MVRLDQRIRRALDRACMAQRLDETAAERGFPHAQIALQEYDQAGLARSAQPRAEAHHRHLVCCGYCKLLVRHPNKARI